MKKILDSGLGKLSEIDSHLQEVYKEVALYTYTIDMELHMERYNHIGLLDDTHKMLGMIMDIQENTSMLTEYMKEYKDKYYDDQKIQKESNNN